MDPMVRPSPPCLCQSPFYGYSKLWLHGSEESRNRRWKSLKIEPEPSRAESRALAKWATTAPKQGVSHAILESFRFEDKDENDDQVLLLLIVRMLKSVTVMAWQCCCNQLSSSRPSWRRKSLKISLWRKQSASSSSSSSSSNLKLLIIRARAEENFKKRCYSSNQ